jgi:hypothetical protein
MLVYQRVDDGCHRLKHNKDRWSVAMPGTRIQRFFSPPEDTGGP